MKIQTVKPIVYFLLLLVHQTALQADSFAGSISSSSYLFSRQNVDGDEETHLRMHESFRFQYRPEFQTNLLINSSGVVYFDPLSSATEGEPAFNLFALSATYRNFFNVLDLDAGRIFVYDPSNSGRIDGINLKGKIPLGISYSLYGGGFVFADGGFSNPVENHLIGCRLTIPIRSETELALAVSQKAHHRETYRKGAKTVEVPNVSERRLGLQVNSSFRAWSVYLRAVQDLHWMNLQEINLVASYSKGAMRGISFSYFFRRPRISYNSIFSVFDAQTNQEITLSATRFLKSDWRLFSRARMILFSDTESFVLGVGMGKKNVSAQYQFQQGYGGDYHRIVLAGKYRPLRRLSFRGSLNLGNYKPFEESWENLATIMAGFTYRPLKRLSLSLDVHSLRNRFYSRDVRMLVRVSYLMQ